MPAPVARQEDHRHAPERPAHVGVAGRPEGRGQHALADVLEALDILKAEVGEQNAKTAAGTTPAPVAQESPTPSGMDE